MERRMHWSSAVTRGKRRNRRERQDGFTLIEAMTVVLIVGLLASVAMPSYSRYLVKARRTEAVIGLHRIWDMQQAYYHNHDETYADDFDSLGFYGFERIDEHTVKGPRYTFRISQPWGPESWYVSATANVDGDDWPDVLITGYRPPED
jgi:prepilin-type N-terminal cleavage/methylation domain-containing protein